MGAPPRLPSSLDPKDMAWVRWATEEIARLNGSTDRLGSNVQVATQLASGTATAHATATELRGQQSTILPQMPKGPPQVPTTPVLTTDHGTVTVHWDGLVHANLTYVPQDGDDAGSEVDPAIGFSHVNVFRASDAAGPFTRIGSDIARAGSIVDSNVTVGSTYYYNLVTTDNAHISSGPSATASVVVKGVDLGTLDQDVHDALQAAQDAATAGQDAAAAAQAGADSAAGQAADALLAAQTAQQKADDAYNAAESATGTKEVYIGASAPTTPSADLLWIDTTGGANTPKHWDGSNWIALTDKAATDAAAAAVSAHNAADAAQTTANTAVTNAQNAQTTANTALTTANGKNKVYYQTAQPSTSGNTNGDLWFDTDDGYKLYVWNGSAWTASQLGTSAISANAITATQLATGAVDGTKLATAVNTQISTAQSTANGKNTVTYAATAPTGSQNGTRQGDVWFVQDGSGAVTAQYVWSGSVWVSQTLTNSVIANLDAGKITTGTIAAGRIGANTVAANQMVAGTITAASGIIADAAITTAKIADLAVTSAKVSALDAGKITTGTLDANRIGANSIAASQMIAGTITAASGIIADAAITSAKIADLAVNNAKINDLDGNKIQAGTVVAGKLSANAVVTNNITAGAVDTNRLAAGAITADKLSLGAVNPQGSPTDRVPMVLTNSAWWSTAGLVNYPNAGGWTLKPELTTASSTGLVMASTATARALAGVTPQLPVPASGKISVQWTATAALQVYCHEYDGTTDHWNLLTTGASGVYTQTLATNTVSYGVYFIVPANSTPAVVTLTSAHVFEVISTSGTQGVELSPSGLQFFDANSQLAMDLTTNSQQFFSVFDASSGDPSAVATIDQQGNATFGGEVSTGGLDIAGIQLTNLNSATSLINSSPNGSSWDPDAVPFLDRAGRGVVYDVSWPTQNGLSVSTQFRRIAQDVFMLEDGRSYQINVNLGGLQTSNRSGVNIYVEFQLKVGSPNTSITDGTVVGRSVVYNGSDGNWVIPPITFSASAAQSTLALGDRIIPANVPIYWQLNTNLSSTPTTAYSFAEFGNTRGITIIDVGSNNLTRPVNGADGLADTHDYSTSGGSSGTTSGGTTATSKTVTFTAKSSRTWNNGGSSIVTGTGQYTNGAAMYYGFGSSNMGSWFGDFKDSGGRSLNSVVGGKTVTSATLTVKNTYTYMSAGATVQFGTAATTTAPGSIGAPTNNVFNATFSKGATKSMSMSSAIRTGLSNNTVNSFVLGVSGSTTNYSYFHGASQSYPPTLKVTYH